MGFSLKYSFLSLLITVIDIFVILEFILTIDKIKSLKK